MMTVRADMTRKRADAATWTDAIEKEEKEKYYKAKLRWESVEKIVDGLKAA